MIQTYLTEQELNEFGQRLNQGRERLRGGIVRLQNEAMVSRPSNGTGQMSSAALPRSDSRDETWAELLALRAIDSKRSLLHEIDQALDRMAKHCYGLCVADQVAISKALLEEVPWAKYCAACATHHESSAA